MRKLFGEPDSGLRAAINITVALLCVAGLVVLAGCANGRFVATGDTDLPQAQADAKCQAQAEAAAAPQWGSCTLCAVNTQSRVKTSCMAAHGYEWVK